MPAIKKNERVVKENLDDAVAQMIQAHDRESGEDACPVLCRGWKGLSFRAVSAMSLTGSARRYQEKILANRT
jgi:hypothetical protein